MNKDITENSLINKFVADQTLVNQDIPVEVYQNQQSYPDFRFSSIKTSAIVDNLNKLQIKSSIQCDQSVTSNYVTSPIKLESHQKQKKHTINYDLDCLSVANDNKVSSLLCLTTSDGNAKSQYTSKKNLLKKISKKGTLKNRQKCQAKEDEIIQSLAEKYSYSWELISKVMKDMGLDRSSKQIRIRFFKIINSKMMNDEWTKEEDMRLLVLYKEHGRNWCKIAERFPERNETIVKNRFYKKFRYMMELNTHQDISFDQEVSEGPTPIGSNQDSAANEGQVFMSKMPLHDTQEEANRGSLGELLSHHEIDSNYNSRHPNLDRFFDSSDCFDQYRSQSESFSNIDLKTTASQSTTEEIRTEGFNLESYQERALIIIKLDEKIVGIQKLLGKKLMSLKWNNFLHKILNEYVFIKENIDAFDSSEEILRHMNILKFCLCRFRASLHHTIEDIEGQLSKI